MTTWTSPSTPEQKYYYSKRKGKLNAYQVTAALIQVVWAYYDFPAYNYIFSAAFEDMPSMLWTAPWISAVLLAIMHYILRETYTTYWFDKLDNDEKTDSSIWIPIALIVVLFVAGRYGVKMSIEAKIPEPVEKTYVEAEQPRESRDARLKTQYDSEKQAIQDVYKKKSAAATLSIDNRIASLQRRRPDDRDERKQINTELSVLRQRRADALSPIEQAEAGELTALLERRKSEQTAIDHDYNRSISQINAHNDEKKGDHRATMSRVSWGSWLLSFFFVFIYCAIGYAIVSIKVKSGILPLRDHTVLDQYGGPIGRAWYVIQDIFNRQFYRATLKIHEVGTAGTGTLSHMDASYQEAQANYNSAGLPAAIPLKTQAKAAEEVLAKMAKNPHIKLSPDQVENEVFAAMYMNGNYKDLPLQGNADSGKKPDAPAAAPAPAGARPTPTPTYDQELRFWAGMVQNQLTEYDKCIVAGQKSQADEISAHILTDQNSPILKEGRRLGLRWGVRDGEFVVGRTDRDHYVPLEKVTESTLLSPISAPDDAPVDGEDENLFKYDLNKFKQEILAERDPVSGKIIGVKYKKADGGWGNIGLSQVRAFRTIYEKYNRKPEPGVRVRQGLDKWNYALSLFDEGREVTEENLQTVSV